MLSHGVPPNSETFHTLNTAQAAGFPNDQRGQHPALGSLSVPRVSSHGSAGQGPALVPTPADVTHPHSEAQPSPTHC